MSTSQSDAPVGSSLPVRILGWTLCFVLGAVLGSIGTVMQQAFVSIGSVPIPYGYVLAAVAIGFLLVGLRLGTGNRISASAAALGCITVVGVLALQSRGGSVLIPANLVGYLWTFTPTVLALVVLAWPASRAR